MSEEFESVAGKVAIVTGGASGIGLALCTRLAKLGAKVVMSDLPTSEGEKKAQQLNKVAGGDEAVKFIACDVTSYDQLKTLFKKAYETFGRIDIVANNAGVAINDEGIKSPSEAWQKIIAINFTAVIAGSKLAVEYMQKNTPKRGGIIINTGSLAGLFPQQHQPVYAGTKSGVVHFSRSCAFLEESENIKVFALCPGFVDTPLLADDFVKQFAKSTQNGELITTDLVVSGFIDLITNKKHRGGSVMRITQQKGIEFPAAFNVRSKY